MNKTISALAFSLLVVACGDPEPQVVEAETTTASLSGTVVFRERIGLTAKSRLEVELQDVSLSNAPPAVIATAAIDNPGQSPITFSIEYDPALINEKRSYSVSAKVMDSGHLILVTDSISPVLTGNAPAEAQVFTVRVSQNKLSQPDASLVDTEWVLSMANGVQVARPERGPEIHLKLDGSDGSVSGYGGCNRFKGSYQLSGNALTFGDMVATLMACERGGDIERDFMQAIGELEEVRVIGRTLRGYRQGQLIISFEADPPR